MIELIQRYQPEIEDLCRRQGIHRLDVFGSAATGKFDPHTSDVDFIAEFDNPSPAGGLLDRYLARISHKLPAANGDSATATARIGKMPDCSMSIRLLRRFTNLRPAAVLSTLSLRNSVRYAG